MKANIVELRLSHGMRQKNPLDFALLGRIRTGTQTDSDLRRLNANITDKPPLGATVLCLYNLDAIKMNEICLFKLPTEELVFPEIRSGTGKHKTKDGKEWKLKSIYNPLLRLKKDCRIIIKRNGKSRIHGCDIPYVNGDTGRLLEIDGKERMLIERDDGDVIRFPRHKTTDASLSADDEGKIKTKVRGCVSQYPVSLGYAQTVYSCQGMTMKRIHIHLPPAPVRFLQTKPNQLYVALSRVTDLNCLTLNRPLVHSDINSSIKGEEPEMQQYNLGL